MATTQTTVPQMNAQGTYPNSGQFRQIWWQWFFSIDNAVALLTGRIGPNQTQNVAGAPMLGPLVNAANDAAAATAGVPIGGLYRSTNAVQIRLV
jgi:hypothetical protein